MIRIISTLSFCVTLCAGPFLLIVSAAALAGDDYVISAAEVTGYGVFRSNFNQRRSESTSKALASDFVTSVRFETITSEIPMRMRTNFGLKYSINTTPIGAKIEVRSVIHFPKGGLVSPSGRIYTKSEESYKIIVGETALHGYGFDEAWEMVPGTWTFEIWHRGAKLIRKSFTVGPVTSVTPKPVD
ncbi:MAG: DUF3859 domain-containing protein [Pseudomonadales bacterium]|nr:DUF3859 domain-containing protein [Pseudomonadales bacterium]MDG1441262.1 DUF3859 domain-containing protein [Pseudomonadales bacterium]